MPWFLQGSESSELTPGGSQFGGGFPVRRFLAINHESAGHVERSKEESKHLQLSFEAC
jgi:hypothetical protein